MQEADDNGAQPHCRQPLLKAWEILQQYLRSVHSIQRSIRCTKRGYELQRSPLFHWHVSEDAHNGQDLEESEKPT
jgi:hypothetical protein